MPNMGNFWHRPAVSSILFYSARQGIEGWMVAGPLILIIIVIPVMLDDENTLGKGGKL